MRARAWVLGPLAAAVAVACATAGAGIDPYYRVDERVAIGAQPTPAQVGALAVAGFRTVINLREDSEMDAAPERLAATDAGLAYRTVPVSSGSPADAAVEDFLTTTDDPGLYPVFIHCATGKRAAALWMVRRVLRDGWTVADAEAEAERAGLQSAPLRDFARDYIRRQELHKEGAP